MTSSPTPVTAKELLTRYDALLLDAYGVLVDASGVLPHAVSFIAALKHANKKFFIVTNDASRTEDTIAARFAGLGLPISTQQIISSAGLLVRHFERAHLTGADTLVVGSADARAYVARAGGKVLQPEGEVVPSARAIVICDATGDDTVAHVECVINTVVARAERGEPVDLILCNPDLIYPKGPGTYGLTSGALMLLVESSLRTRLHVSLMPTIKRLGKPFGDIFDEAKRRAGSDRLGLVGDQLGTDVLGARDAGIDSILVGTGLTQVRPGEVLQPMPHFYLPDLRL